MLIIVRSRLRASAAVFSFSAALFLLVGCATTVTPTIVRDNTPSFDGTNQNSGVLYYFPDGSLVITPLARERYNLLVEMYGWKFTPPLKKDDDIWPGPVVEGKETFRAFPRADVNMRKMTRWRKAGLPTKP